MKFNVILHMISLLQAISPWGHELRPVVPRVTPCGTTNYAQYHDYARRYQNYAWRYHELRPTVPRTTPGDTMNASGGDRNEYCHYTI